MDTQLPALERLRDELKFGQVLIESGFLPKHIVKPAQAVAIMQRGRELGLSPMEALSSLYIVHGKVTCDSKTMLALALRSGVIAPPEFLERTDTICRLRIARQGGSPQEFAFRIEDAMRLKAVERDERGNKRTISLSEKAQYEQQPRVMLQWRCVAEALRVVAPDALAGLYTHEEMGLPVRVTEEEHIELDSAAVVREERRTGLLGEIDSALLGDATAAEASGAVASPSETGTQPPYVSEESEPAGRAVACPKCGLPLKERHGAKGRFLGCTGYPKCRHTESIPHEAAAGATPATAPDVVPAQNGADVAENQPSASAPPPAPPIDQGQIDTIKALGKDLLLDMDGKRALLAPYGVKKADELNADQGDAVIRALRELVAA